MRRLGWLAGLLLITQTSFAGPPQWAFRIVFADKTGSPSLSNPSAFLSNRALQRRTRQNITVVDADRPVSPAYLDSVIRVSGGKMHNTSRWLNQCVILVTDSSGIGAIRTKPFVVSAEVVGYFATGLHKEAPEQVETTVPVGQPAQKGTGNPAYYGFSWTQTDMVHGDVLHDAGLKGTGQLIAVLDLGFNGTNTHPGFDSLRQQGRIIDQYNFVSDNTDIYSPVWSHGTAVLSTMAGLIPNTYVGTAPNAQYALYLTDDNNYSDAIYELDNMIAGIERADSLGADIITTSLGYNTFTQPYTFAFTKAQLDGHTTNVARAANIAVARGIFFVVSAGNEGGNSWNFLLTPSDADSAVTVGAVNSTRVAAGFSSPGPNSSGRIKPDVCLMGDPAALFNNTGVTSGSGTSYSAPQLAGWAACLRQLKPGITPAELRTAIVRSADRFSAPHATYGYGIPDFRNVLQYLDVNHPSVSANALTVAPNPFRNKVTVSFKAEKPATVQCAVYDITGKLITTKELSVKAGTQEFSIDLPERLPAGTYTLKAVCGNEHYTQKLIKL